ncbi:hypothetical protein ACFX1Z_018549 [Malus domestica]
MVGSPAAAVELNDSGTRDLCMCDDLWFHILSRLSQLDLMKCKIVAKSWHRIISDVWLRRFWSQSPIIGLYYRTLWPADDDTYLQLNYVCLHHNYNYWTTFWNNDILEPDKLVVTQVRDVSDSYLDCCNGLILFFNLRTCQFCVFNPITKQHVSVPIACAHEREHFCAALAFDPLESNHYRIVRIDYSPQSKSSGCPVPTPTPTLTLMMDIFSSQSGQWARRGLQLDPNFVDGFKTSKVCRHFVYLRGVLYGLASSQKVLCIDLNTVKARAFELPRVLGDDDKTGATMGCLGVSKDLVCYVTCDSSKTFRFWSYNDRRESGDQWTLKYSAVWNGWVWGSDTMLIPSADIVLKPYAISPNAHVIFYGTSELIFSWDLESHKGELFDEPMIGKIAPPGYDLPFFTQRAFLIPFYSLGERNIAGSTPLSGSFLKGAQILSAEALPCECDKLDSVQVVSGRSYCNMLIKRRFTFPSEMQLCAGMELPG